MSRTLPVCCGERMLDVTEYSDTIRNVRVWLCAECGLEFETREGDGPRRALGRPTEFGPGHPRKVLVMIARESANQALWHPKDGTVPAGAPPPATGRGQSWRSVGVRRQAIKDRTGDACAYRVRLYRGGDLTDLNCGFYYAREEAHAVAGAALAALERGEEPAAVAGRFLAAAKELARAAGRARTPGRNERRHGKAHGKGDAPCGE